jgi:Ca-activated chloride channel family protein
MAVRSRSTNKPSKDLDVSMLIASIVAGIIGFVGSAIVYDLIRGQMWSPLAVGISFAIFATIFFIVMAIVSSSKGYLEEHTMRHKDGGKIFAVAIGIILLTLLLGLFFEWLYELEMKVDGVKSSDPTSYVFIIDNSGSMDQSDPQKLRYAAISQIISQKDSNFPYAVYGFNNEVTTLRELAPISAGNNELFAENIGGTMIKLSLETLYSDYETKLKDQLGSNPKFLLLSDGYASDISFASGANKILKKYAKTDITISTVGLGNADEKLMTKIAQATGGVYIGVDNISALESSMQQAITIGADDEQRTLYTYRSVPRGNFLYALMRIVFTALLGILISMAMIFVTGKDKDMDRIFITSIITGLLAGLLLEVGINAISAPAKTVRALYFVLVAMTFVTIPAVGGRGKGREYDSQEPQFHTRLERRQVGETKGLGGSGSAGDFFGSGSSSSAGRTSGGSSSSGSTDFKW